MRYTLRHPLLASALFAAGMVQGCWDDHDDDCLDDYFDCIEDAEGSDAFEACEAAKEACLADCDDGWSDDGAPASDDGDPPATDDGDPPATDDGEPTASGTTDPGGTSGDDGPGRWPDDTGSSDDGATTGSDDTAESAGTDDGGGNDEACLEIHEACLAQATTIAQVDACEALLAHCLEAEPCDHECEPVCPDPGVVACLDDYEGCVASAADAGDVAGCADAFDVCVADLDDSSCVPQDPTVVDACLEQHALCTDCVDGAEDLWLCKQVFDTCVAPV